MNIRYSIRFNEVDTWLDWGLIPTSRPVFNPPPLKSKHVDLPGIDGGIDLTDVFGKPRFGNRTGSFEFVMSDKSPPWYILRDEIINLLHGKIIRAVLYDDPNWFYEGRFVLNTMKSTPQNGEITIDYTCYAEKKEGLSEIEDWLWDPFDFETGEIKDLVNIQIDGSKDIVLETLPSATPLTFVSDSPMIITFNEFDYHIPAGRTTIPQITRANPPVSFRIFGNGIITIIYRGGSL